MSASTPQFSAPRRSTTARSGPWPGSTSTTATLPGTCRRSSGCSRISHCSTSTPTGSVETVPHITPAADNSHWSPSFSSDLYRIDAWGGPYFTVNSSGNVAVRPHGRATLPHQEIDLLKIVKKARSLQDAFDLAIRSHDYGSHYQGVYSVKCNQDRFVVEDIVKFGSPFRFRLEVGSKPELLLAMSCLCKGNPDALLICNGFKDLEYISLALYTRKLTVIVLEQEEELDLVVDLSRKLGDRNGINGSRTKYASSSERCRLAMVVFVVDGPAIPIADELAAEFTESEAQEWPAASTVTQPRQLLLPQTASSVLLLLPPPPSLASQLPPTSKTAVKRLAGR
ncbi:hypothetical protein ACFX13_036343 [Malus domestica]